MQRTSIKIDGVNKVVSAYVKFVKDTNSKAGPILQSGAEILKAEAKARAPMSKSGLKKGKWAHPPGTLRNSIDVGEIFRTRNGVSAAVGIKKNKYFTEANFNQGNLWYARWVEFGTKERTVKNWWGHKGVKHSSGVMPASPFMRPALKVNRPKIRNLVQQRLKEELFHA
jgi:HK97 gp10 family phage protein